MPDSTVVKANWPCLPLCVMQDASERQCTDVALAKGSLSFALTLPVETILYRCSQHKNCKNCTYVVKGHISNL
jgi:hypothetical protein